MSETEFVETIAPHERALVLLDDGAASDRGSVSEGSRPTGLQAPGSPVLLVACRTSILFDSDD